MAQNHGDYNDDITVRQLVSYFYWKEYSAKKCENCPNMQNVYISFQYY